MPTALRFYPIRPLNRLPPLLRKLRLSQNPQNQICLPRDVLIDIVRKLVRQPLLQLAILGTPYMLPENPGAYKLVDRASIHQ